MLSILSLRERLRSETLEGVAITSFIRWLLFLFGCVSLGLFLGVTAETSLPKTNPASQFHLYFYGRIALTLLLILMDLRTIRKEAKSWSDQRIYTMRIMARLPLLLLIFIPVYFLAAQGELTTLMFEGAVAMLWVFSFISVFFYLVYFVLLLVIFKLPKRSSVIGFALALGPTVWGFHVKTSDHVQQSEPPFSNPFALTTTHEKAPQALGDHSSDDSHHLARVDLPTLSSL